MRADSKVVTTTKRWLTEFIIHHNICPFAQREFVKDRIHYAVYQGRDASELLEFLGNEIGRLMQDSTISTSLIIHPKALSDFADYN